MSLLPEHPAAQTAIKKQLQDTAVQKNRELGMNYYSEDPEAYQFMGCNMYDDHALFVFQCPRSASHLAIRINKKIKEGPAKV